MGFQYEVKPPCWRKSLLVLDNFTEFPTLNCGSSSRSGSKTGLRLQRLLAQMCFLWAFYGLFMGGLIFQESKVYTVAIGFLWCSMLYSFGSGIEHVISSRFQDLDERASLHSWEGAMLGAYLLEQTKPTSSQIWSLDSLQVVPQDLGSNTHLDLVALL